mmetsp:Transcript_31218/g.46162  ORF Transcript_31218/g.46162 Transcript_31218/m.46162 type:complete len:306 (-) Transcript_31218:172-1089(-)|eukprot:CAMPEP_0195526876 /NCGR_PEP_ID=MMETSP0794_2-20130614/28190_1 /TAXON_ID=515487 /ORGANISM="Stephanopyxis turris, Strain CCMP 815" /LENGTH=305 /DNA_ID=CAMNT_0040657663 /DNA_START=150 /DNA_END=1067 /DNA_ORIENTATION=+
MSAYALPNIFPFNAKKNTNLETETTLQGDEKNEEVHLGTSDINISPDLDVSVKNANFYPSQIDQKSVEKVSSQHALSFELSVMLNGRNYNVRRTLPLVTKLRNDLLKECDRSSHQHVKIPEFPMNFCERECYSDPSSHANIPLAASQNSVAGKGFTLVHNMMRWYGPAIEGWLSNVCTMLPKSPSLTTFLWEPINGINSATSKLWRIDEDDEYSDDESCSEGDGANQVSQERRSKPDECNQSRIVGTYKVVRPEIAFAKDVFNGINSATSKLWRIDGDDEYGEDESVEDPQWASWEPCSELDACT